MILIDMPQISLASIMMHLHTEKREIPDEKMVRHMILNSLRLYRTRHLEKYGELVLCYDSRLHYWRRDYFPEYKYNRKISREKSGLDWTAIYKCLNTIKHELDSFFPYKVLEVYGAEADDIIAVLVKETSEILDIQNLIISGDKDFIQLQRFSNVAQYSPITKKSINGENPTYYLAEHILKGDTGDGIPNVLSPDHTFSNGLRQIPLGKKKISQWLTVLSNIENNFPNEEVRRNYHRNKKLIDLLDIPKNIINDIINTYRNASVGDRKKLLPFFIQKELHNLMESLTDF